MLHTLPGRSLTGSVIVYGWPSTAPVSTSASTDGGTSPTSTYVVASPMPPSPSVIWTVTG